MFRIALVGLAAVLAAALTSSHAWAEGRKCIPVDDRIAGFEKTDPPAAIPEAVFLDKDYKEKTLDDWKGTPVVLNFWATWCAPCVREMPSLQRLRAKMGPEGLEVLTVSEDRGGIAAVKKFFELQGLDGLPILADKKRKLMRALKVQGLPTTVFIDAEGHEVGRLLGPAEWDSAEMEALIRGCLGVG